MKLTASLLAIAFTFFLNATLQGQPSNKFVTGTTIPAPNAGSLGKYADIPVSYFTGVPDISIPIYTVEEGPLKLPISLSYHASGIKVAETASWVGLGWSLNAGGMITRTVQGMPDETPVEGYYNFGSQVPATNSPNYTNFVINNIIADDHDTEMDLFSFNVGGYTGKFYIDHKDALSQGKPAYRFVPQQDLQLEFLPDFSRYTIIAPDGTRYTFGQVGAVNARESSHQQNQPGSQAYYSSWYLVLIESADRKFSISLSYADEYYEYKNLSSCTWVTALDGCGALAPPPGPPPTGTQCAGGALDSYHYTTTMEMTGKRLTSINFSSGAVNFLVDPSASANRADLEYGTAKKLESIQITAGSPQVVCKKFDFTYDYYQDPANTTLSYYKRLRLTQLQEKSCDGALVIPPHIFNYQGTFLPYRMSKATDHWGYYNGASQNETQLISVPATTITNSYTGSPETYGSANKESNQTEMLKGMLTDITYPTSGKTFFTYESNVVQTGISNTTQKLSLINCNSSPTTCCGTITGTSANVSFAAPTNPSTKFNILLSAFPTGSGAPCNPSNIAVVVKAYLSTNPATPVGTYSFNFSPSPTVQSATTGDLPLTTLATLTANTNYFFTIQATDGYGLLKITETSTTQQNYTVGGLRIKQIRVSETGSATPVASDIIKDFEYLQEGSSTASSGVLFKKPVYGFDITGTTITLPSTGVVGYQVGGSFHKLFFSEATIEPLFNLEGYHFGYARVKEKLNGNGSKVVKMYTTPNSYTYSQAFPYPPAQPNVSIGKTQFEYQYNEAGAVISQNQVIGTEFFTTPPVNAGNMLKVSVTGFSCVEPVTNAPVSGWGVLITQYKNYTNAFKVTSKVDILDGVTTTTSYTYDGLSRFLAPTATEVTNSNGQITRTELTYPHDLPAGCIRDSLLRKNMISEPWKTVVKVNGVQVNGSQQDFAAYILNTGAFSSNTTCATGTFPRPYQVKNYEVTWNAAGVITTGAWVTKGTFDSYNAQGKPASFTTANWADPETYTWRADGALLSRTFKANTVTYNYHTGTSLLQSIVDVDGQSTSYIYDKLGRLSTTSARGGNITGAYTYTYKAGAVPNYVKSTTTYSPVAGSALNVQEVYQYLDGLGRPIQTVGAKQSPAQKDVVSTTEYDKWGRVSKVYNPFETTTTTGAYVSAANIPGGTPYTLNEYYSDPLNRPWKVTPLEWYATIYQYGANVASEVKLDHTSNTYYTANTLLKTTVTDPDGKKVISFKDLKGRTILVKRTDAGGSQVSDMYSLYDDKDRPKLVIPPGATISNTDLTFAYTYDGADNMLTKKVPDAAIVNMRYNTRDQLALQQDGNLLALNLWRCMQYDDYGRLIKTGLYDRAFTTPILPTLAPTDVYTENVYGTTGIEKGRIIQAKVKEFDAGGTWLATNFHFDPYGRMSSSDGNNHLLPADATSETATYSYDFADQILQNIRTSKKTALISYIVTQKQEFDHWGRLKTNKHKVNSGAEVVLSDLNYNWKNDVIEKNLGKVTVGATTTYLQSLDYTYNAQGWLKTINTPTLGGTNTSQVSCATMPDPGALAISVDPDNKDLFYLDLKYDVLQSGLSGTIQKSGNISQVIWRSRGRERQSYSLGYDFLDRLTTATYNGISDAGTLNNAGAYNENLSYDPRGNITNLTRTGKYKNPTCWTDATIDNLAYTYTANTNRLQKIADATANTNGWHNIVGAPATAQFTYDANGNLATDPYKGMAVQTNFLNLPVKFTFPGNKVIDILYDGSGSKLRKTVTDNGVLQYKQDYVSGIEYRSTSAVSLSLESIYHAEGRVFNTNVGTASADALRYEYTIKDHLGNARLTFTDKNGNGVIDVNSTATNEILQENEYYPFGLTMSGPWINDVATDNSYEYNGKELNTDFGLGWYDYEARWYDPAIGRFPAVDPIIEKFPYLTPYNYASNSPVSKIDLYGLQGELQQKAIDFGKGYVKGKEEVYQNTAFNFTFPVLAPLYNAYNASSGVEKVANDSEKGSVGGTLMKVAEIVVPVIGLFNQGIKAYNQAKSGDYEGAGETLGNADGSMAVDGATAALGGSLAGEVKRGGAAAEAGAPLEVRAKQIQDSQPNNIARNKSTTSVATVINKNGKQETLVASSRDKLTPAQMQSLKSNEKAVAGKGHAESTIVNYAKKNGMQVKEVAASRPSCPSCVQEVENAGGKIVSPKKQ